jgi:hydrogenase expression/formation protein HypE
MGLDPVYMGNEGKMIAFVSERDAAQALEIMRKTENGRNARIIGRVTDPNGEPETREGSVIGAVTVKTRIGGTRRIDVLFGEGLPRIC